jgi:hypothetical protein
MIELTRSIPHTRIQTDQSKFALTSSRPKLNIIQTYFVDLIRSHSFKTWLHSWMAKFNCHLPMHCI